MIDKNLNITKVMKQHCLFMAVYFISAILLFIKPGSVPRLWFDEGWALSLARNWVEFGHYGHFLDGKPIPSTILNTGFPAISLYALNFKLLGVGLWQARIPGVMVVLMTLPVYYILMNHLFGKQLATIAVVAAFLLPADPYLHPLMLGRLVLGEMPAILYLLLGYLFFMYAYDRTKVLLILPAVFWSLALQTKPQVLPFLFASFFIPFIFALLRRNKHTASLLFITISITVIINYIVSWGWRSYMETQTLADLSSTDPYAMVRDIDNIFLYVIVFYTPIRITVVYRMLFAFTGLITFIGLVWYTRKMIKNVHSIDADHKITLMQLMLWSLTTTWLLWFLVLSNGSQRYGFPGTFLGSIYAGILLRDVYSGIKIKQVLEEGAKQLRSRHIPIKSISITILTVLIVLSAISTIRSVYSMYTRADTAILDVIEYIDENISEDEVIETYESEIFFFTGSTLSLPSRFCTTYCQS